MRAGETGARARRDVLSFMLRREAIFSSSLSLRPLSS